MYLLLDLVGQISGSNRHDHSFDNLVQNLFPSNFFGNCDIEEERMSLFSA
jgi:hypothetical protein